MTVYPMFQAVTNLFILILIMPLALPVMGLIALLILLDSGRPVFYISYRVGKDGRPIPVYKFRTMYTDADARLHEILQDPDRKKEWQQYHKLAEDPRVTRIGRWLRKASWDELPQLFNVLRGHMNIIGPRPAFEDELTLYPPGARKAYLSMKPGITGLWQVKGRSNLSIKKRMSLDAFYARNRTVCLDLWILWRTLIVVITRKGAY